MDGNRRVRLIGAVCLTLAVCTLVLPADALAAWRSSEIEEDDSNTTTVLIVVGAVVAVAAVAYMILRNGDDDEGNGASLVPATEPTTANAEHLLSAQQPRREPARAGVSIALATPNRIDGSWRLGLSWEF